MFLASALSGASAHLDQDLTDLTAALLLRLQRLPHVFDGDVAVANQELADLIAALATSFVKRRR